MLDVVQTCLRVHLGYHTTPQVLVGALLGSSTAAAWFGVGTLAVLPALQQSKLGLPMLYTVTLVAMAAFAMKNVMSWADERKKRWQRQKQQTESSRLQRDINQSQPHQHIEKSPLSVPVTVAAAAT